MTTIAYSRPKAPRPSGRTPTPVPKLMPAPIRGAQPQQAQGRDVVNQGGQRGVVGRGGNFQALGNAALSKLPAPTPTPPPSLDQWFRDNPSARGNPWTGRPDAAALPGNGSGGDIQTAIQGLKSQLGMPADADATNGMPSSGPGSMVSYLPPGGAQAVAERFRNLSPDQQMAASVNVRPDAAARLRSVIGGGLQGAGAGAGAASGAGGFMPGKPNPYAEILRQRLGAGGGGQLAGQYAY